MYTADTNVIIYYLKGDGAAVSFFDKVADARVPLYISGVTETETLGFPPLTEKDMRAIEGVLSFCTIIHTNPILTREAAEICRRYNVKPLDALIAATALFTSSTLVTRNVRDFKRIQELTVKAI